MGGADYAHDHVNVTFRVPYWAPGQLYRGHHGIVPAGLREDAGNDISDVENGRRQKDLLYPLVVSFDHQQPDGEGAHRHRDVLADMKELQAAGDPGELRHHVAEVDDHQQQHE